MLRPGKNKNGKVHFDYWQNIVHRKHSEQYAYTKACKRAFKYAIDVNN